MRSLVMSDQETNTEWSHLLGRGMAGELKGEVLKPIVSDMLTWGAWLKEHPDTTVLDMKPTSKNYSSEFYRDLTKFVFGFETGGEFWYVTMAQVSENPIRNFEMEEQHFLTAFDQDGMAVRLFETNIDDRNLQFVMVDADHMRDQQTMSLWGISSGEAIEGPLRGASLKQRVGIMSYKAAWMSFHPHSREIAF